MKRPKLGDIQLWVATLVAAGFGVLAAFIAVEEATQYYRLAKLLKAKHPVHAVPPLVAGNLHTVARMAALVCVVVAAIPGVRHLSRSRTSIELGRWPRVLLFGLPWLGVLIPLLAFFAMPALSTTCPCLTLRYLELDARVSLSEVPLAALAIALLWALRFQVHKQLAADRSTEERTPSP